jgi:predicted esterase
MHFLCLHGMGTNNEIFKLQTAALRRILGSGHTYDFVEGSVGCPPAPGLERLQPDTRSSATTDEEQDETGFYAYLDSSSPDSAKTALEDLADYVDSEGPFDGVLAFSQGAGLAASLIIQQAQQQPTAYMLRPVFKCGIFFSGGIPGDPSSLRRGEIRPMKVEQDGEVIHIATAHIWGDKDDQYPDFGPVLAQMCSKENRETVIWDGKHEIPGLSGAKGVEEAAAAIKKTIQRVLESQ